MTAYVHRAAPTFEEVSFRSAPDGTSVFTGYAAVFESRSKVIFDPRENARPFTEIISPGAFARTLTSGRRQSFLVDHEERQMIADTRGQLRLAEDSRGLLVESPWPRTDYADNVRALHDAGQPLAMSFSFKPSRGGDKWDASRTLHRLNDVAVGHVTVLASLVPAYDDTVVQFRALAFRMETDMDDLDALFTGIKDGRELTDEEKALLRRLADDVTPEPEAIEEEKRAEPDTTGLEKWKQRTAEHLSA